MTTFSYSVDNETFHGTESSAEAAALRAVEDGSADPGQTIWVGESVPYDWRSLAPDAYDVIQHMMDAAWDGVAEFAEGWLSDTTKEQEDDLTDEIRRVIVDWVTKNGLEPKFYAVKNVREMVAPPLS